MHMRRLRTVAGATGLLGGCATAVGTAWWLSRDLLRPVLASLPDVGGRRHAEVSFTEALDAACAAVLLGSVCWLTLGAALTVASYAAAALGPAGRVATALDGLVERSCPRRLRRLVLVCLGVAIGAGATAPATAHSPGHTDRPATHRTASADGVSGLAVPDRTTGTTTARARRRPGPAGPAHTVLVRPGDSLWTIASELLPPGATDRTVTAAWHRLHEANARRIGADPDLILPGTRLEVPDPLTTAREERR